MELTEEQKAVPDGKPVPGAGKAVDSDARSLFLPCGMATGIGSVPFKDPGEALDLILAEFPLCPHWPQLPLRGNKEHFVHQFLQPLVECELLVHTGGRWFFHMSGDTCAESLTTFYSAYLAAEQGDAEALRSFLPGPEAAAGFHAFMAEASSRAFQEKAVFLKGQIAGPLTVGLELKDEQGRPAYYRDDLRDVVVKNLALNARAQAAALSSLGRPAMIFVDDPGVGAFGSRMHLALSRESIQEDLTFIFEAVRAEGALSGIHSCEAVDWSLLTESGVDIISADIYRFGSSLIPYAGHLRRFIERGGTVAWGIAPTLDDPFAESAGSLLRKLRGLWKELFPEGTDLDQVLRRSMITPACGTGLLEEDRARRVYRLTSEVSRDINVRKRVRRDGREGIS
jgi:hypothetical protein